jgi:hypothetical protein
MNFRLSRWDETILPEEHIHNITAR